jgi:hypothetical protein
LRNVPLLVEQLFAQQLFAQWAHNGKIVEIPLLVEQLFAQPV